MESSGYTSVRWSIASSNALSGERYAGVPVTVRNGDAGLEDLTVLRLHQAEVGYPHPVKVVTDPSTLVGWPA